VLLDQSAPRLRAYPYEAIVAEKFQAMVMLGRANSWMKDFYDIWTLAQSYAFDDDRLALNCHDLCTAQTEIPTERLRPPSRMMGASKANGHSLRMLP
jgi:predicted nucleotidyltransferase component of viral defense system